MRRFVRRYGLRGGGQAPASFAPSFKPSFQPTTSVFGGGGSAPATASFLSFDGTSTFVEWSTGPSTVTDGRRGTFVVPFNRKGGSGPECILYVGTTTGESVFIGFDSTNHLVCRISDGAVSPTAILTITSTSTYNDSVNRVAIFSFDLDTIGGAAFYWLYVNDTDETGTPTTGVAANIDYTDKWRLGSTDNSTSRQWYSGATGHILFYPEVFPLPDANTRKYFYDAALDGPVDQGADGSDALGDQPPLYWATTAAAATANKGDGGNADSASSFSDAASPPNLAGLPGFVANAVQFDDFGLSGEFIDYVHTAGVPGDGPLFFWHICFRRSGDKNGVFQIFWDAFDTVRPRLLFNSDNTLGIHIEPNRWEGVVNDGSSDVVITDTAWHTLTISCDASTFTTTNKLSILFDGAAHQMSTAPTASGNLNINATPWALAHQPGLTGRNFDGDLAEVLAGVPASYIDLEGAGMAAKFYSGGKPVFQGLTGMKNLGVRPAMWFRAPAAYAGINPGLLAHGTITGTVSDATTSPTD